MNSEKSSPQPSAESAEESDSSNAESAPGTEAHEKGGKARATEQAHKDWQDSAKENG